MSHRLCAAAVALVAIAATACTDAVGPASVLTTTETAPALNVETSLPTLPALVSAALEAGAAGTAASAREPDRLMDALAVWTSAPFAGTGMEAERQRARHIAAPDLAAILGAERVDDLTRRLGFWVEVGSRSLAADGTLGAALSHARTRLVEARLSRNAGDLAGALEATMAAADALHVATPQGVAERLVGRARVLLGQRRDEVDDASVRRADRLLRNAEEALADGDYPLAIRRAFYAGQLLGIH